MKAKPSPQTGSVKWEEQPLEWPRATDQVDRLMVALEVRKKRQRRRRITAAGGAAAMLIAATAWFATLGRTPTVDVPLAQSGNASVTLPERRELPDGSIVELKPGAEMTVHFTADSAGTRAVELTKGEALFQVAKNPVRPFVVTAGGVRFRAVGTAFSVDLRSDSVGMLVTEGTVAVEKPESTDRTSASNPPTSGSPVLTIATVEAGHSIELELTQVTAPVVTSSSGAETAERLAWRVPRLDFNETPLWEVVSLLNQHSGSRISLANPELGRVEISGALRADNIEPLLQTLEANYHIQVIRRPNGEIELRKAP